MSGSSASAHRADRWRDASPRKDRLHQERGEQTPRYPARPNEELGPEDRDERIRVGQEEFEAVNLLPPPPPTTPYFHAGILNFVFGHVWKRPGLSRRDRRLVTIACVGLSDAQTPIDSHVGLALGSGDITWDEMQEIILQFSAYYGFAKGEALQAAAQQAGLLTPTTSTGLQLLVTAERLFARHGLDGVSLRQIAAEAGQHNNSAVRYHFGSKDQLLQAVFGYRLGDLIQRRALLLQRADPDDLRSRVEAHLLPLLELAEAPDNHYVSFVEQLQRSGAETVFADQEEVLRSRAEFAAAMGRFLGDLPDPARAVRIGQAQDLCVHLAAERERAVSRGDTRLPFALYVSTAVDAVTGLLAAPASPETARLIARRGTPSPGR